MEEMQKGCREQPLPCIRAPPAARAKAVLHIAVSLNSVGVAGAGIPNDELAKGVPCLPSGPYETGMFHPSPMDGFTAQAMEEVRLSRSE